MINNPLSNHLNKFFRNGASGASSDAKGKSRSKQAGDAKQTDDASADKKTAGAGSEAASGKKNHRRNFVDAYESSKANSSTKTENTKDGATTKTSNEDSVELSAYEARKKRLEEIQAQVEADYAAKYPGLAKKEAEAAAKAESTTASQTTEVVTSDDSSALGAVKDKEGVSGFINDMPLFEEFKTGLMDAFKRLDSSTSGSISAQYELNYTSMQYIANEAGGYEYKETSMNIKLDLNYVKAAGGSGKTGAEIASAIENAEDFESFCAVLQDIAKEQARAGGTDAAATDAVKDAGKKGSEDDQFSQFRNDNGSLMSAKQIMNSMFKNVTPDGVMKGMQDYFGPEATAGRIVDFATAFFPLSDEFKNGGDTEESRKAFSERMGKAIQKGFDDAIGKIGGNYDGTVKDGVDKTHELVFKGLEDFVKGKEKTDETDSTSGTKETDKKQDDKKKALEEFAFSFQMNYTHKTSSVSYGSSKPQNSSLNTEA